MRGLEGRQFSYQRTLTFTQCKMWFTIVWVKRKICKRSEILSCKAPDKLGNFFPYLATAIKF